jgi:hypothetical protein
MPFLTRALPGGGYGFWLRQDEFAPTFDPAWTWATDTMRRRFWAECARLALREYAISREAGIDRHGMPLIPIAEYTREHRESAMGTADPDAPPLVPAHGLSRTTSFLRSRYVPGKGLWFWWIYDPRVRSTWGKILHYHATGRAVRGKPRDVMDLDDAGRQRVREGLARWWMLRRRYSANLRIEEFPDAGLSVPIPARARVVAPSRRQYPRQPLPAFEIRTAKASFVSSGGQELGAGTKYVEMKIGRQRPSWLRKAVR